MLQAGAVARGMAALAGYVGLGFAARRTGRAEFCTINKVRYMAAGSRQIPPIKDKLPSNVAANKIKQVSSASMALILKIKVLTEESITSPPIKYVCKYNQLL